MHFMPEDEGYEEKLWPDGYKAVIKGQIREVILSKLHSEEIFEHAYVLQYKDKYANFEQFLERITEMLVIGAEKGGDEAFDDIVAAFLYELPLPEPLVFGHYLLMPKLPEAVKRQLIRQICDEYREDEVFVHAYNVGYWDLYENYEQFLSETAVFASVGVINGIDNMLTGIFKAFATAGHLPPARRNAKRVKNWFVPKGSKIRDAPISRRKKK